MRAFHLDRQSSLIPGQIVSLEKYSNIADPIQDCLDVLFPSGISRHGWHHLLAFDPANRSAHFRELVFEYARRAFYDNKPSRLTSVFGYESLSDVQDFRLKYWAQKPFQIVEIERDPIQPFHRADMNLVSHGEPNVEMALAVDRYWQGLPGSRPPVWEILMVPPVRVTRIVDALELRRPLAIGR